MTDGGPLETLLLAYAPGRMRERYRLGFALDRKLADIVRSTTEPAIGQMRLTWWHNALVEDDGSGARGEPLLDAIMRHWAPAERSGPVEAMIDGWEALMLAEHLDAEALLTFARGRGALFNLIAEEGDGLRQAGEAWALWDASGRIEGQAASSQALGLASARMQDLPRHRLSSEARPLAMLTALVRHALKRGQPSQPGLTKRQYLVLLRAGISGVG